MKKKASPAKTKVRRSGAAKKSAGIPAGASPSWAARFKALRAKHEKFLARKNPVDAEWDNGVFERFVHPAIT
jgi:4-O-beta-D-mannosyl-D-glucose phosphorylase